MNTSNATNSSVEYFTPMESSFLLAGVVSIESVGLIANGLTMFGIMNEEMLSDNPTNIFLLSQAFADFCFLLASGAVVLQTLATNPFTKTVVSIHCIVKLFANGSMASILALTVNRLISIRWPYKYVKTVTPRRAKATVAIIWLLAIALGIAELFNLRKIRVTRYVVVVTVPIFIVCYVLIFQVRAKHRKAIRNQRETITGQQQEFEDDLKSTWSLVILTVTFVAGWLPLGIAAIVIDRDVDKKKFARYIIPLSLPPMFSSATNPFVYYICSEAFRRFAARIYRIHIAPKLELGHLNNSQAYHGSLVHRIRRRLVRCRRVPPAVTAEEEGRATAEG